MKLSENRYLAMLQRSLSSLNAFEISLLAAIMILSIVSFVLKGEFEFNNFLAALSAILGVFCVVLGAKGSMANWIFGIFEGIIYTYICFAGHIYGDALQRLLYTLPMQFIGWHLWSKRERNDGSTQIVTRYMSWGVRFVYLILTAAMTLAFGLFLKFAGPHLTDFFHSMNFHVQPEYANEYQLWFDAASTVLAIVTTWISAKAYVEPWYLWLVINFLSISIWIMSDSAFSFMIVSKYSIYTINCIYGIWMWHRLSKN